LAAAAAAAVMTLTRATATAQRTAPVPVLLLLLLLLLVLLSLLWLQLMLQDRRSAAKARRSVLQEGEQGRVVLTWHVARHTALSEAAPISNGSSSAYPGIYVVCSGANSSSRSIKKPHMSANSRAATEL
jgi:uncharacterized protein (DUF58 family)